MKAPRLISLLVAALLSLAPMAFAGNWEEGVRLPDYGVETVDAEGFSISSHGGYIYIATQRTVSVKLFTILGQTVEQTTLAPGSYRFKVKTKGIYILKVGSITRRVTI